MEFQSYSYVYKNSNKVIKMVRNEKLDEHNWCALEKVKGHPLSFWCDGKNVLLGNRKDFFEPTNEYFNSQRIFNEYQKNIQLVFYKLQEVYEKVHVELKHIAVYGTIYGGEYPSGVEKENDDMNASGDKYYHYKNSFVAFDVLVVFVPHKAKKVEDEIVYEPDPEGKLMQGFMNYNIALDVLTQCRIPALPSLLEGDFKELVNMDITGVPTKMPELNGLLPIEDNYIEGFIIKPVDAMVFQNHKRAIVKID